MDDVSIAVIQTKLDNMLTMLTALTANQADHETRLRAVEVQGSNNSNKLADLEKEEWRGVMARKPTSWPAVAGVIVQVATLFLFLAGLWFLGPQN